MQLAVLKAMMIQIRRDTGVLIVKANQDGAEQPSLPYGVYKVTSPYTKGKGRGNTVYRDNDIELLEEFIEQPLCTISFNAFAEDGDKSNELAMQLHNWFSFFGSEYLEMNNIAIRRLNNVEDRTTHLVDHYEHKYGFDVQLRTEKTLTKSINWIEEVNIQEGN